MRIVGPELGGGCDALSSRDAECCDFRVAGARADSASDTAASGPKAGCRRAGQSDAAAEPAIEAVAAIVGTEDEDGHRARSRSGPLRYRCADEGTKGLEGQSQIPASEQSLSAHGFGDRSD